MSEKEELRERLNGAMSRTSNPNNTPEKMASVLSPVCGVGREKVVKFINGDDDAIDDSECTVMMVMS